MKSGIIIFNAILLVLIAILFYLHFSGTGKSKVAAAVTTRPAQTAAAPDNSFKIAYFDMDSLEASFAMIKDVQNELNRKQGAINAELTKLERSYKDKLDRYQGQAPTMNQVQSEMATKDMMQMQQQMQGRKQALDQEYQDFYVRKMNDVKARIEAYLKDYNAEKGYSYILAYDPGLFYYRDTMYNITGDLVKGLNSLYKKK